MQYLSDESEKLDDKELVQEDEDEAKRDTETPDVILVEDDSDTNDVPSKKRARSDSGSRERNKKAIKPERRVVVDMTRERKCRQLHKDKTRLDSDRKRDERVRPREDKEGKREQVRKDDRCLRKVSEKQKEDARKDEHNRKVEQDQLKRKDLGKRDDTRKRESDGRR